MILLRQNENTIAESRLQSLAASHGWDFHNTKEP